MSDERELTADGWPIGVTREQILVELGISRELAAECERMAALSEAKFEAMLAQRSEEVMQKIGTSTKLSRRWLSKATQALREAILQTFEDTGKPVTVRDVLPTHCSGRGRKRRVGLPKNATSATGSSPRRAGPLQLDRRQHEMDAQAYYPMPGLATSLTGPRRTTARTYGFGPTSMVEVRCEKDALAGVLMPVTREYDVPLMVARGYSSETFAYNAAEAMRETGKPCYVYYVGDFDPSGWISARSLALGASRHESE